MNCHIVILTKEPCPGTVKTRLIPAIGPEAAARLHEAMAIQTIECAKRSGLPVRVALSGVPDSPFARRLRKMNVTVEMQPEGDLGARLAHAMRGPLRTIAMGTDCVVFKPEWIREAAKSECVSIGPADDGGYWLIAATPQPVDVRPALFNNMHWSTSTVCEETVTRIRTLGRPIHWLPASYDVDTPDDLFRLQNDPACPPAILAALAATEPTVR